MEPLTKDIKDMTIRLISKHLEGLKSNHPEPNSMNHWKTVAKAFTLHIMELATPGNENKRPSQSKRLLSSTLRTALHKGAVTEAAGTPVPEDQPWAEWLTDALRPWVIKQGEKPTGAQAILTAIPALDPVELEALFTTQVPPNERNWPVHPGVTTQPDKATESTIIARGWTKELIIKILGAPDQLVQNPYYRKAPEMRLYNKARVEEAERDTQFQVHTERKMRRSLAALRSAQTRRISQLPACAQDPMWLYIAANTAKDVRNILTTARSHTLIITQGPTTGATAPIPNDRDCVDFLHQSTVRYPGTTPGPLVSPRAEKDTQKVQNTRALMAIARQWPELAQECHRQILEP